MEIRKLVSKEEFTSFTNVVTNAYPAIFTNDEQAKQKYQEFMQHKQENDPDVEYYGLFQHNQLIGGMRIHYYEMNLYNNMIKVGGVGSVAVDLLHKKERAAKSLMEYFLNMFREKNCSFVALYSSRPDFYKKMGFGYGPNMYQYSLQPSAFPKGPTKAHLVYASVDDLPKMKACYNRFAEKTHGMMYKTDFEWQTFFKPAENRVIAFQKDEQILGYIVFSFKKQSESNFLLNNLIIKEFIYETPEALLELSTFLNSQADQIQRIEWNTHDENIRFLLSDARTPSTSLIPSVYHPSATAGIGLMYRIIHIENFIQNLEGKRTASSNVKWQLTVTDSFFSENNVQIILRAEDGILTISENPEYDVALTIDIPELSSLLMGVTTLKELYMYSKVQISDVKYIDVLNATLYSIEKPICTTAF